MNAKYEQIGDSGDTRGSRDRGNSTDSRMAPMDFMQSSPPAANSRWNSRRRPFVSSLTSSCMSCFHSVWDSWRDMSSNWDWPSWWHGRVVAVYFSGFLFSLGWWLFIDGIVYSHYNPRLDDLSVSFVDWLPGVAATLGMLMMNMVNKDLLDANEYSYSGDGVAWKARLWFFVASLMEIGAVGGAVGVMAIKYYANGKEGGGRYMAYMVLLQSCMVVSSGILLWAVRNFDESISI